MVRLLRFLFPFWGLFWLTLFATASGLWVHWYPRWRDLGWGLVEMLHVFFGWIGLAILAGYLVHHLIRHWGDFTELVRAIGLIVAGLLGAAALSGVVLVLNIDGGPPGFVRSVHFWSTFPIFPLLLWHTWGYLRRWLRAQTTPESA